MLVSLYQPPTRIIIMSERALKLIAEAKEKHLTELNLRRCDLTEIPEAVSELSNLTTLVLLGNQVSDVGISVRTEQSGDFSPQK